jgi:hypothetical protein
MPTEREAIRKILDARPELAALFLKMIESGRMGCTDDIDPNEPIIVCAGDDHGGVIGSAQRNCTDCQTLVWLSPSTLEMLEKRGSAPYKILCLECVMKTTKEGYEEKRTD